MTFNQVPTIENIRLTSWEPTSTGVGFQPSVLNGWKWWNNKFSCKDLVHHPIETTIYMWMAIGSRVPFGKVKPKWDFHKSGYWLDPNFPWENPRKINLFLFQMLWIRVETVWPAAGQTHGSLSKIQPCADSCRTLKQLYWKDCFYQATSFTTSPATFATPPVAPTHSVASTNSGDHGPYLGRKWQVIAKCNRQCIVVFWPA